MSEIQKNHLRDAESEDVFQEWPQLWALLYEGRECTGHEVELDAEERDRPAVMGHDVVHVHVPELLRRLEDILDCECYTYVCCQL